MLVVLVEVGKGVEVAPEAEAAAEATAGVVDSSSSAHPSSRFAGTLPRSVATVTLTVVDSLDRGTYMTRQGKAINMINIYTRILE